MAEQKNTGNDLSFKAELLLAGKTATGIQVPDQIVTSLGSSKKPAVVVSINGYDYRSTVATMGGKFMLPVSADVRKHARIAAGDTVHVSLTADDQPREVVIPEALQNALQASPDAQAVFSKLSYSNKSRIVLSVDGAKTEETRMRRIEKAINDLKTGKI